MALKLYNITTTLVTHPDFMAGLRKSTDEIYSFFALNQGDAEWMKRKKLDFVAGAGYTLENIEKTDFIDAPSSILLFSPKFVERMEKELGDEIQFFPCNLICQKEKLNWYAARIMRKISIVDKEASKYFTLTNGENVILNPTYRKDIEERFFIARDEEEILCWVVSELFLELCRTNDLLIHFAEIT